MEKHVGCNDHTGALLVSKPATKQYEDNWEFIFRKVKCCKCGDIVGKDNSSPYDGEDYCKACIEKMWLD